MPELRFRTNAKVERLLGRELITSNVVAIFELVKNAYDAGARSVEVKLMDFQFYEGSDKSRVVSTPKSSIQIIDNGKGMSLEEIDRYWMELGTPHKEVERIENVNYRKGEIERVARRVVNGDKGIGRFGVDKIASYLQLETIDSKRANKTIVYFDWDKFNDTSKKIEDIPCEYEQFDVSPDEKPGLKLSLLNLRDMWTIRDVESLKRNLKKFLSPISLDNDEFRLFFTYGNQSEELCNDSFQSMKTFLEAELHENGHLVCTLNYKDDEVKRVEEFFPPQKFGTLKARIYYLDRSDKRNFSIRVGMTTSDYGNIRIYRDNFRVFPYGEPTNDWLEIDRRHAQGIFRTIATRDLIGYILLPSNTEFNGQGLREATNRIGFVEDDEAFVQFAAVARKLIQILEQYVFDSLRRAARDISEVAVVESSTLKREAEAFLDRVSSRLAPLVPQQARHIVLESLRSESLTLIKQIDTVQQASKEAAKKATVLAKMQRTESLLFEMLHAIRNKLSVIDSQLGTFEIVMQDREFFPGIQEIRKAFAAIQNYVTQSLKKVTASRLQRKVISFNNIIKDVVRAHTPFLDSKGIELVVNYAHKDVKIRCLEESIVTVFDNLFSNAQKALIGKPVKKITIDIEVDSYLNVYFSDNGSGITDEQVPYIFSLWTSHTGGSGIGLASVQDIIQDHQGEVSLVRLDEADKITTFHIKLPLVTELRAGVTA